LQSGIPSGPTRPGQLKVKTFQSSKARLREFIDTTFEIVMIGLKTFINSAKQTAHVSGRPPKTTAQPVTNTLIDYIQKICSS
jgi:hypothetical protein